MTDERWPRVKTLFQAAVEPPTRSVCRRPTVERKWTTAKDVAPPAVVDTARALGRLGLRLR